MREREEMGEAVLVCVMQQVGSDAVVAAVDVTWGADTAQSSDDDEEGEGKASDGSAQSRDRPSPVVRAKWATSERPWR